MGLAAGIFNQGIQNPQILKMLSDKVKDMLEKSLTEKGAHLLQWYPAKSAIAGKLNAVNLAFRCTATDKLPMPLYLTVYCFIPDRQVTGLAILCADIAIANLQGWLAPPPGAAEREATLLRAKAAGASA
jgi:hypothetical protein